MRLDNILLVFSLIGQIVAAYIAISLIKRTKYNVSWILISCALIIMVFYRLSEILPVIDPELAEAVYPVEKWLGLFISLSFLVGLSYVKKLLYFMQRAESIRRETEKEVLSAVIKTEEKERRNFAKELHDGLGPLLSVAKMLISDIDETKSPEVKLKIRKNIEQAIDEAVDSVRTLSMNISPHVLNRFGLRDALNAFIRRFNTGDAPHVMFTSNIEGRRFAEDVEVIAYRVVCELINNSVKHADCKNIKIDIQLKKSILYMEYEDDGKGFDLSENVDINGMGLDNIKYRLNTRDGNIKIISEPGEGMKASAFIKL